jgi:hypothetical protein
VEMFFVLKKIKQGVVFALVRVLRCNKVFVSLFESFSANFAGHAVESGQVIKISENWRNLPKLHITSIQSL